MSAIKDCCSLGCSVRGAESRAKNPSEPKDLLYYRLLASLLKYIIFYIFNITLHTKLCRQLWSIFETDNEQYSTYCNLFLT